MLLTALVLALTLEGIVYFLFPGPMKRFVVQVLELPEDKLRVMGLGIAAVGVFLLWLILG